MRLLEVRAGTAAPLGAGALASDGMRDKELVECLRRGDEQAFAEIVVAWSPIMVRIARMHVSTDVSAEEVVQETWLAVIQGLPRFEGRSSLKTWVLRILTNRAISRGLRESRTTPMSSLVPPDGAVDPNRFHSADESWPGHWTPLGRPAPLADDPEGSALAAERRAALVAALQCLPERQRSVVAMRDVAGLTSREVCAALEITPVNQRVLLHRGRTALRTALERLHRRGEV